MTAGVARGEHRAPRVADERNRAAAAEAIDDPVQLGVESLEPEPVVAHALRQPAAALVVEDDAVGVRERRERQEVAKVVSRPAVEHDHGRPPGIAEGSDVQLHPATVALGSDGSSATVLGTGSAAGVARYPITIAATGAAPRTTKMRRVRGVMAFPRSGPAIGPTVGYAPAGTVS